MSYAPVIALDLRTGQQRLATELEVRTLGAYPTVIYSDPADCVTRRLSCSDPCDMREIWRLAAIRLGRSEEQAMGARIMRRYLDSGRPFWTLLTANTTQSGILFREADGCRTFATATEALCLHCWGSK